MKIPPVKILKTNRTYSVHGVFAPSQSELTFKCSQRDHTVHVRNKTHNKTAKRRKPESIEKGSSKRLAVKIA